MHLSDLENAALGLLSSQATRTPEDIRRTLRTLATLLPDPLTGAQIEQAAQRIETKLCIVQEDAAKIQLPFQEWLPLRRADTPSYFYPRYQNWLGRNKGFSKTVLGVLDKDTDKIVGLLEDPLKPGPWKRRGLVVGHVQSGKTANYTGVICKAADYGYRFIVVLSGIQENLRVQTQERIEEGFIGISSETDPTSTALGIGVGAYGLEHRPIALTSRSDDFRASHAKLPVALQSLKEPLVLVMKKNARILSNLVEWLKSRSQDSGGRISEVPMLLIDDEADNASVNTSSDETNPTSINRKLRELLGLFDKNVYLGYTATPFANIFIDPDSSDAWDREDLFPSDFIVSLEAPTNYVGASRMFLEDGDLRQSLVTVQDHHELLPERHKIDLSPDALPESLLEALNVFILGRALRIVRGQGSAHSSMLVNVSRFNDVQTKVTGLLANALTEIRLACQGHASLPPEQALKDPTIARLLVCWETRLKDTVPEAWAQVQGHLAKAAGTIEVRKINSKSPDTLDYRKYKQSGLHVIAVGGLSLSRGFTLEGLMVSYFLRNSLMYDTLLQMGRWFGYRDGYEDLCRTYMTPEAIGWYGHICEAIEELREDLRIMERQGRAPKDFGLRVRSHPDALIVTARNKMRTGQTVHHQVALGGRLVETSRLRGDALSQNFEALSQLISTLLKTNTPPPTRHGYIWKQVEGATIKRFLQDFRNHDFASMNTQTGPLLKYIAAREEEGLTHWDVCLYSPPKTANVDSVSGLSVGLQKRSAIWHAEQAGAGYFAVSGTSSRVASRGSEEAGMSPEEIRFAREEFYSNHAAGKEVSDKALRRYRTAPLLMLHLLNLECAEANAPTPRSVMAFGVSFPPKKRADGRPDDEAREQTVAYVVNTVWYRENFVEELEEFEEDADA